MSKSSAATASKTPPPLSTRSAWSKGPPNTSSAPSPRSQSPALPSASSSTPTHSRRPSTLGQGVSFKDGVAGARSPVGAPKQGSSLAFGSIDDATAPLSSSPASVPPIKSEAPKSFGSVTATSTTIPAVNGKPSTSSSASVSSSAKPSTPSTAKFDIKKLFQGSSSGPSSTSSQPSDSVSSPSTRPGSLPPQHSTSPPQASSSHTPQSSHFTNHPYPTFIPANSNLRPAPNGTVPPRSPVYSRQQPNGAAPAGVNGRSQGGPGASPAPPTPMSAGMPSPRMGVPLQGQQPQMPQGQPVQWGQPYYYQYPGMPQENYMYGGWQMSSMPPHQHPHTPGQQPPQPLPHHNQHPQPGMPMSPRHPPSSLHPPGTPTMTPAGNTPSPHIPSSSLSSVTSPPSTPASATGPGAARMDRHAQPFIPRGGNKVVIKNDAGLEVKLEDFKRHTPSSSITAPVPAAPVVPVSPARKPVKIETEEARTKRLAEEERVKNEKAEKERAKREAEEKAKRDEEERKQKAKAEAERIQKEKEEAEQRKKEAEQKERLRLEEEEKERVRKEAEEKERIRKEAEEKERLRKEEEEKERIRKEQEEKERIRKEEEERAKKEAEEAASKAVPVPEAKPEQPEETEAADAEKAAAEKEEARDKVQDKPPLRLDTALDKKRPGPLDLSGAKGPIAHALPSALATARIIEDISTIAYPDGVQSPSVELNKNSKQGKFRYDRDFLLQFMAVCKEKPDSLPPLDAIGLEPSDQNYAMARGGSGRRGGAAMGPPSSTTPRQAAVGLGISGFKQAGFNMGQFATQGGTKMSSEERFAMSSRSASMSGSPAGLPFGRPGAPPMVRSSSQGGPGAVPMGSNRTRSKRGEKRGERNPPSQQSAFGSNAAAQAAMMLEPVAPLEVSANRWTPASLVRKPSAVEEDSPAIVDRKVKSLLNKLTMEKFDSISDQIISWANKSETEKDGRTLIQVIRLVFEKATDEAAWSEMYARLCRKMMEQISPKVQDDGIRSSEGKHITGGHLFRKYLLNRCQEDFERGWASKEAAAAAAAAKAGEDKAAKDKADAGAEDEIALYSDEYYAAQKAKRQGLGLIKFIGELFKLQMLTERIMHECVKKLLGNVANPEEEEIESLCKLLTTVGALLDSPKAHAHMDVYFSRMKELTKSPNVNSRMQYMLQDVIEMRERKWVPRTQAAAPTTLAAVHEAAAKEKASQEKESYQRTLSMSRGGSRRGAERNEHGQIGPDGWAVAGAAARPPTKAGDLSQFGKIGKTGPPATFGPASIFANKKENKRESISRTGSANMFSMLSQNPELAAEALNASKSSRPPSRKPSIDLGAGGAPDAPLARRKLNLLPRSVPKSDEKAESTPAASTVGSEDEGGDTGTPGMSEAEIKARIDEDSKEFFSIRDLGEAETYFTKLPVEHRHRLVDKLVMSALESKEADATLVADFFSRAVGKNLCSPATFEDGFMQSAEILDDVAIDAPKAPSLFVKMMKGAGLDKDEARRTRLAGKSEDSDKLLGMLSA